jgi:pimeloyl-ACP methyl ester carboxylesterase
LLASVGLRRHRGLGQSLAAFNIFGRALHLPLLGALLTPVVRWGYRRRRFPGADRMTPREIGLHLRSIGALSFTELSRAVSTPLPPTLVAFCRDDHMLEPAIAEELASVIPGARRLAFETGGHNFQKTRAPELAAALLDLVT